MDAVTPSFPDKAEALALRYGEDSVPAAGPWNETLSVLLSHRSVRGLTSDPLPAGTLETLVAAAQSAATSSNLQTWSVIAVTDQEKKAKLAKMANNQKHIEVCPLFLCWLADVSRNERLSQQEDVTLETLPYFETFLVSAIDAALAAQNATVAAEALGLSCVYIGAMRNHPKEAGELLGLPPGAVVAFGMCVGYMADDTVAEVKPRLPQDAILYHNTYGNPNEAQLRVAYDAKMAAFSAKNEMSQDTWTKRVIGRMGKIPAMSGRERLVSILNGMGFPLK